MRLKTLKKSRLVPMPFGPEAEDRMQQIRAELAQRNAEHEPGFYVLINEAQAEDLASGYVPLAVKAMCRTMLDWQDEERRCAERPVRKRRPVRGELVQGRRVNV